MPPGILLFADLYEACDPRTFFESIVLGENHFLDLEARVTCLEVKLSPIRVYSSRPSLEGVGIVDNLFLWLVSVPLSEAEFRDICRCAGRRERSLIGVLRASSASNLLIRDMRLRLIPRGTYGLWVFAPCSRVSSSVFGIP
jgi:hypothetical protein